MKTARFVKVFAKLLLASLIVFPLFASASMISSVANAQGTDHPWPQFLQNPQLTSYSDGPAPRQPAILWTYTFGNYPSFSVASSYGKVFVGCQDSQFYALNESSGQKIWNYTLPFPALSSPAAASGKVFASSADGNLYALDETTGSKIWNYTLGLPFFTYMPPPTVADGMVFASSVDSKVYALNQTTGDKIWNFTTDTAILGGIAVSGENVFIADLANLYALSKATGVKIWNYTITGSFSLASPVVASNRIFVANGTKELLAIDQFTGSKIWNFTTDGQISASPAVAYGKIFLNTINVTQSEVYALDMDGNVLWQSEASGSTGLGTPAVADGMVFVTLSNATYASVYTFNQSDGSKVWQYDSPLRNQFTSPIIADGKLIVAFNSTLTAFGIHDLKMAGLNVPSTASPGDEVLINVTVQNTGDFTESSSVTVYVNDTSIGTEPISSLAPGAATMVTLNWNTTGFEAGTYNVTAAVATVALERITTDNTLTSWVIVGIHNLTLTGLNAPSTVNSGDQALINVTVQNTGNFTESSSVAVYVNDTNIGTQPISSLAPGTAATLTVNWNTTGLQPGNCSITAMVLPVDLESTTNDNMLTSQAAVNAAAGFPPELWIGIIIAVIVVVAIIATAVYLRRRKPKKTETPPTQTAQPPTQPPADTSKKTADQSSPPSK